MKNFREFCLYEFINTREIDPKRFQNPGKKGDVAFFKRGFLDGLIKDDIVRSKEINISANKLKPSQTSVFLGKSLDMAVRGYYGGDLGSIVSSDLRILDGHHRWAATIFANPTEILTCTQLDMTIGDLIPVLRQAGDILGNTRGVEPDGGDINIFEATIEDAEECILTGKGFPEKNWNLEKAKEWFEKNRDNVSKALEFFKKTTPPAGALPREQMPKIKKDQVDSVERILNRGGIDVRTPYAE
jgi:hypothetical protein